MIDQFEFQQLLVNSLVRNQTEILQKGAANLDDLKEYENMLAMEQECLRLEKTLIQTNSDNQDKEVEMQELTLALNKLKDTQLQNTEILEYLASIGITRRGQCFESENFSVECNRVTEEAKLIRVNEDKKKLFFDESHLLSHFVLNEQD